VAVSSPVPVLMALGLALVTLSDRNGHAVDSGEAAPPLPEDLKKGSGGDRS
jgi:putative Mg2+ transporter-C (MgtC) family protein